jgi:hypothetical protein
MVVIRRNITCMFDYLFAHVVAPLKWLYFDSLTVPLLYLTVALLYVALLHGYLACQSKAKLNL